MEPEKYIFKPEEGITAYEFAQIFEALALGLSESAMERLPVELRRYFEEVK